MFQISKKLKLQPLQTVKLLEIEEAINKKKFMSIDDFRELIQLTPGISSQLQNVVELPIHESTALIKKNKFTSEMFYELISEYKERIGI